jgi:hypothetical protein
VSNSSGCFHFSLQLGSEWLASSRHLSCPRSLIGGSWRWSSVDGSCAKGNMEESCELKEEILEVDYFF